MFFPDRPLRLWFIGHFRHGQICHGSRGVRRKESEEDREFDGCGIVLMASPHPGGSMARLLGVRRTQLLGTVVVNDVEGRNGLQCPR